MHPAFTKMSHFLCACLPVLFPSQHSQQDHTSRCGYGDPDQRERIPCLGHSRRRKTRPPRRRKACRKRKMCLQKNCSSRPKERKKRSRRFRRLPLAVPIHTGSDVSAPHSAGRLLFLPSAVLFRPQGLRDTAAFWLRQSPGEAGTPHSARRAAAPCRHPAAKKYQMPQGQHFHCGKRAPQKHMPRRPHPPASP